MNRSLRRAVLRVVPVGLAVCAGAALAQNLYPNPDFHDVDGDSGWTATAGTVDHQTLDARSCPLSGSLSGEGTHPPDSLPSFLDGWGPCVPVPQGGTLYVAFDYEGAGTPYPGSVLFGLRAYAGPSCQGQQTGWAGIEVFEQFPWARYRGSVAVPAGGSVRMVLDGGCMSTCVAQLDRIRVTRRPVVFLDGFEGGGVCEWSRLVQ